MPEPAQVPAASASPVDGSRPRTRNRPLRALGRIALAAATTILSVNLWTGFPLLALWIGSQSAGGDPLSMRGIVVAVLALAALMAIGVVVLTRVSLLYDRLAGRRRAARQPPPWLRSMRSTNEESFRRRRETNAIEVIVVMAVIAAVVAFEVWFFLLATT
jgi:hypothetical protein